MSKEAKVIGSSTGNTPMMGVPEVKHENSQIALEEIIKNGGLPQNVPSEYFSENVPSEESLPSSSSEKGLPHEVLMEMYETLMLASQEEQSSRKELDKAKDKHYEDSTVLLLTKQQTSQEINNILDDIRTLYHNFNALEGEYTEEDEKEFNESLDILLNSVVVLTQGLAGV